MPGDASLLDLLRTGLALVGGYLVGSLPLATWIGRAAGLAVPTTGRAALGTADVRRLAGPGWGLLALAGDLTKGIVPVAIAIVTFGWWTGWVAGVGVLAGVGWPSLGRRQGERSLATAAGVGLALAPLAGILGLGAAGLVVAAGRAAGRRWQTTAVVAGSLVYGALAILELGDAVRLAGLAMVSLVALAAAGVARPKPETA